MERRICNDLQWNMILRRENELTESLLAAIREPHWRDAHNKLVELCNLPQAAAAAAANANFAAAKTDGRQFSTANYMLFVRNNHRNDKYFVRATAALLRRRVVQLIVRLSVWHSRYGEYPERLDDLNLLTEFAGTPDELFVDPFTADSIRYTKQYEGFELRSPGANGKPKGSFYFI